MTNTDRNPATQRVLNLLGGGYEVANVLGISAAAVSQWDRIPRRHVQKLSELTGLPPDQVRPPDAGTTQKVEQANG